MGFSSNHRQPLRNPRRGSLRRLALLDALAQGSFCALERLNLIIELGHGRRCCLLVLVQRRNEQLLAPQLLLCTLVFRSGKETT